MYKWVNIQYKYKYKYKYTYRCSPTLIYTKIVLHIHI